MPPRVRFSPSPTGPFHVGGARSALFNWMFARREGGAFLLRNEDTDPVRSEERWLEGILDGMRWLGMDWDEEIVHQSQRRDAHLEAATRLYEGGHAYWCDCTPEQITERKGPGGGYDGFCRDRGLEPGNDHALRFRVPEGSTTVVDVIREEAVFDNAVIDDFVIVRRGGAPIFVLANAVDDVFQRITHVIRGEEHLSTTPKYLMIRHALGHTEDPVFAHLPLLVNEKRQKLSKRRDKVALLSFRDEDGYLAEAMTNYLVLLGWAPREGDEIQPIEDLVKQFRLEDVSKSPAFFDVQKLQHVNAEYLRAMSPEAFTEAALPFVHLEGLDPEVFARVAPLAQTRVKVLSEVEGMVAFLFTDDVEFDEASWQKAMVKNEWSADVLRDATAAYADCEWDAATLLELTTTIAERRGLKLGKAQAPIRVAVTGKTVGLPLFESLEALGRETTQARLAGALDRLAATAAT
jgi:glutamyl-tRNA synthetase